MPGTPIRLGLTLVLFLSVLWRLPSLFDPPWVNDEGTYYAIAQGMAHGLTLYGQLWENKPPGVYLIFGMVYRLLGPSLIGVRILAAIAVLITVILTARLGQIFRDPTTGVLAALTVGLLFGIPFLEGTTSNAETFAAPFVTGAVYLGLVRRWWFAAGILIGLAILLKSVAVFDGSALGVLLLLHQWRRILPYAGAIALVLGGCVAVAWRLGVLAPMLRDAVLYDIGYVSHANGGQIPWLLAAKFSMLVGGTVWLARRPFRWLWLFYAVAGALFSGRVFGHYFLQAVVPFALCVTPTIRRASLRDAITLGFGGAVLLAGLSTGAGVVIQDTQGTSILTSRLQYYGNFARLAVGAIGYPEYRARLDDHVNRNLAIVDSLRLLPPGPLLVWGNTPWVYPLSNRLPATAYTSSFRSPEVPGETTALRRAVVGQRPRVVVVIAPALPALGRAAPMRGYRLVASRGSAAIYAR